MKRALKLTDLLTMVKPSARERAALACLSAIAAMFIAFTVLMWKQEALERAKKTDSLRGDFAALVSKGDPRAVAHVNAEMQRVRRMVIIAPTREIAIFQARTLLRNYAIAAAIEGIRVESKTESENASGAAGDVKVSLAGVYDKERFYRLMRALSNDQKWLGIDGVSVDEGTRPRFQIDVRFVYMVEGVL